jgi:hypothetical protein
VNAYLWLYIKFLTEKIEKLESKNKEYTEEISSLRSKNAELHRENLYLKGIIDPIRKKAEQLYPELETVAALAKISKDIDDVRILATKDIYRPPTQQLKDKVVNDLKSVYMKYKEINPTIVVKVHTGNKYRYFINDELIKILKDSGFKMGDVKVNFWYGKEMINAEIEFHSDDINFATDFANSPSAFLNTKFHPSKKEDLPKGTIEIAVFGEPQFLPNGAVVFK